MGYDFQMERNYISFTFMKTSVTLKFIVKNYRTHVLPSILNTYYLKTFFFSRKGKGVTKVGRGSLLVKP